jgi:ATP-dependent exoDNAse (exonuclease V) beta subunit
VEKITALAADEPDLTGDDARQLSSFLTREGIFEFFQWPGRVLNEKTVVLFQEGEYQVKRIDRLLLKDNEFVVIDYKTGEIREEDRLQVREYLQGISEIFPRRSGRGFLWYPILDRCLEVSC